MCDETHRKQKLKSECYIFFFKEVLAVVLNSIEFNIKNSSRSQSIYKITTGNRNINFVVIEFN
jgi:hypothetical protein